MKQDKSKVVKDLKQLEDSIKKKVKTDFGFTIVQFLDYDMDDEKNIMGLFLDSEKRIFAFAINSEQPENPLIWRRGEDKRK